jgi:P-type E1-E2 ATPase
MIFFETKNLGKVEIHNLVLDMNGTIACDGNLIPGIAERIALLKKDLKIYLISADTFGTAKDVAKTLAINFIQLNTTQIESDQKAAFIESIGSQITASIGNGQNDIKMLKISRIGVGVIGSEGMRSEIVMNAKIIVMNPLDAFDLFLKPKRLIATLRD